MQILRTTSVPILVLTLLLSACGGGDDGAPGGKGINALISVSAEPSGTHCAGAGSKIEAGLDADADGTLAAGEVASTQYVCNGTAGADGDPGAGGAVGAPGNDGLNTLVQMLDEPSGAHCAAGGKVISAGIDSNTNGVLDAPEISSTGYVCNGANGASGADGSNGANGTNGASGTNGLSMLMSIVGEPAGANCAYGGNKVGMGLDSNTNNVLDAGEVSATSYVCSGAPDPMLNWVGVTGTTVQAQSNTGYIASNDTAPVVLTLPASPAIGDVVRINGAGLGGWKIAQNTGQAVYTTALGGIGGARWTARASTRSWTAVSSSADGRKLAAVAFADQVYTSTDGGIGWTARGPARGWIAIASSADGSMLLAASTGGQLYTSTDSGVTWTPRAASRDWTAVASSIDGSKLVATAFNRQIYTSTDGGVTWTPRDSNRGWQAVASSADGTKLVAAETHGQIYTSADSGITWTAREQARVWWALASSADGSKLVAADKGGQLHTSTDSGVTWVARDAVRSWESVASSADGNKLAAVVHGGQVYTSTDSGVTWTARGSSTIAAWTSVGASADGSRLVALGLNTSIQISTASTGSGTAGSIGGTQFDAIGLQYVGGGMFNVLDHVGSLAVD
jgi:hypothetical protein